MSNRTKVNASLDSAIFRHTARQTKRVNLFPYGMRGGIRL